MMEIFSVSKSSEGCAFPPEAPFDEAKFTGWRGVMDIKSTATDVDLLDDLYAKALVAAVKGRKSWSTQSTEEEIAVAIALNRGDWLKAIGYTLAEAVAAMESRWIAMIPGIVERLSTDLGRSPERLGMPPRKSSAVPHNQLNLFECEPEGCDDSK
jgi:hypothetical protein